MTVYGTPWHLSQALKDWEALRPWGRGREGVPARGHSTNPRHYQSLTAAATNHHTVRGLKTTLSDSSGSQTSETSPTGVKSRCLRAASLHGSSRTHWVAWSALLGSRCPSSPEQQPPPELCFFPRLLSDSCLPPSRRRTRGPAGPPKANSPSLGPQLSHNCPSRRPDEVACSRPAGRGSGAAGGPLRCPAEVPRKETVPENQEEGVIRFRGLEGTGREDVDCGGWRDGKGKPCVSILLRSDNRSHTLLRQQKRREGSCVMPGWQPLRLSVVAPLTRRAGQGAGLETRNPRALGCHEQMPTWGCVQGWFGDCHLLFLHSSSRIFSSDQIRL